MPNIDLSAWTTVSPLLDLALTLGPAERARLLEATARSNPAAAAMLERLLTAHEQLSDSDFLEWPSVAPVAPPGMAGTAVGAYTLDSLLGAGGMGVVWKAHRSDGRYEGAVAIKLLQLAAMSPAGAARFTREGSLLARLAHPHIARLFDAGVAAAGQPYLVLEYVEGQHIDRYCDEQRLDVAARLGLFQQVCHAVAHAHAQLVVHRDLKPSNILVDAAGQVKLLDFGIAAMTADADAPANTAATAARGFTPEYAAPEQVTGGAISTATDVHALGVLLYVLLTGRHPLHDVLGSPAALLGAIADVDPPPMSATAAAEGPSGAADGVTSAAAPSRPLDTRGRAEARRSTPARLRQQLRGDLDAIVGHALQKSASARYVSVAHLADDLVRHLEHRPIAARPVPLAARVQKFVRRNRVAVGLGAVAAAALAVGTATVAWQATQVAAGRALALHQLARAESMNDLNQFLLADAAPHGRPFTAGELLIQAEQLLQLDTGRSLEIRVDSLTSIGRAYWSQDEDDNGRRVLAQAYELSAGLPASAGAVRAKAACAYGAALAAGDDIERGQALIREGLALLPDDQAFAFDRVFCELRGSDVAIMAGDGDASLAHVAAARRLVDANDSASDLLRLTLVMDEAEAYRMAGQLADADTVFARASAQMTAMGRDRTEKAGTLFNNWGLTLYLLGRPRNAEPVLRRALDIGSADADGASVSPMVVLNVARPVAELGQLAEALELTERAGADAVRLGHRVVEVQAMLLGATIRREMGDPASAARLVAEFDALQRSRGLAEGHIAFAASAMEQSAALEAQGELEGALAAAERARAIAEASTQSPEVLPRAYRRLAGVHTAAGRAADAVAAAERAVTLQQNFSSRDTPSSVLGRTYFTLGKALADAGRTDEARNAAAVAARHLEATLGSDHSEARAAQALLASLN